MSELIDFVQLKLGNSLQRKIFQVLSDDKILDKISLYDPLLVGSIPLELDTKESDVDLICCFTDQNSYMEYMDSSFSTFQGYKMETYDQYGEKTVTVSFLSSGISFEIFAQQIPGRQQMAYRLLLIKKHLLDTHGPKFKTEILKMQQLGMKSEEAICKLLDLKGNPYLALLNLKSK